MDHPDEPLILDSPRAGSATIAPPDAAVVHGDAATSGDPGAGATGGHWKNWLDAEGRALRLGVAAGVVLSIAIVAYLFIPGTPVEVAPPHAVLRIPLRVQPAGAEILLDDRLVSAAPAADKPWALPLIANDQEIHWLEVRHRGYYSIRRPVSALACAGGIDIALRRRPVELHVETDPPDAEVWVDGELRGFSPLQSEVASDAGERVRLRVVRPGFHPADHDVPLPAPGDPIRVALGLKPLPPRVRIETKPPSAEVMIDGKPAGTSPLTVTLADGDRGRRVRVTARLERFEPAETQIDVPTEPQRPLPAFLALDPAPTVLVVDTTPSGGWIRVNGRDLGDGPVTLRLDEAALQRPIELEGSIVGSHFGRLVLPSVERSLTTKVALPLEMYGRRVVFAFDCSSSGRDEFELQRLRLKEQIHALLPEQRFAVASFSADRIFVDPDESPVPASFEQKIRAYDRIEALQPMPGPSDPAKLVDAALTLKPDSLWLFTLSSIDRTAWFAAIDRHDAVRPTIQFVTARREVVAPWLTEWLAAHRGLATILHEDRTATSIKPSRREP